MTIRRTHHQHPRKVGPQPAGPAIPPGRELPAWLLPGTGAPPSGPADARPVAEREAVPAWLRAGIEAARGEGDPIPDGRRPQP